MHITMLPSNGYLGNKSPLFSQEYEEMCVPVTSNVLVFNLFDLQILPTGDDTFA